MAATADDRSEVESESADNDDAGPGPSKRQKFQKAAYSEEEVALIEAYFGNHIRKGRPANPSEARAFLKLHPMKRNFKQIQDKVRHLISR